MPGVSISTAVRTGPVSTGVAPASTFFLVGETERGTDGAAIKVASLADYATAFGGYEANKHTYQQVRTFFEEGGAEAYIARATAAAGVKATLALQAEPSSAAGVTLTAVGKGVWGNDIYAVATNNSTTFAVEIYYGGTAITNQIFAGSGYVSLSEFIDVVNHSNVLKNYVTASLTASASPTALLKTAASAHPVNGADGSIVAGDFVAALDKFGEELGAGAVAIPGLADGTTDATDVWGPILEHCVANNRIGLCSFGADVSASGAASSSTAYNAADSLDHEYLAFFYPWVNIPSGSGTTLTVPPEAYVAAVRSKMQNATGTWRPYAGIDSESQFVTGVIEGINRTTGDMLDDSYVNAIRIINNTVRIYGARSHSTNTTQWRFITQRETINYVVDRAYAAVEPMVFETINGRKTVFANVRSALISVLEPIRLGGGLYEGFDINGKQIDFGYTVKVDDSINPLSQLETGRIKAQVGVRVSTVGDKIDVTITKSNLTATLV